MSHPSYSSPALCFPIGPCARRQVVRFDQKVLSLLVPRGGSLCARPDCRRMSSVVYDARSGPYISCNLGGEPFEKKNLIPDSRYISTSKKLSRGARITPRFV